MAVEAALPSLDAGRVSHETGLVEQTLAVARRAVVRTARQRGLLIFPMIFPLILFAINGSALSPATRIPDFPTRHYRDFLIAMTFVQGAMFVSITAGVDLARDIESGFLNRLALTPLRTQALLIGQLGGALVLGVVQAVVYLLVGLATGVDVRQRRRRRVRAARPLDPDRVRASPALAGCSRCASGPGKRSRASSRCCS